MKSFLRTLVLPFIVNKAFMMYFGLNYSEYPGKGYGYGLALTIVILLFTIGLFLWKFRHIQDP